MMERLYLWTFQLVNTAFSRLAEFFFHPLHHSWIRSSWPLTIHLACGGVCSLCGLTYVARITLPESGFKSLVRSSRSVPALIRYTSVALNLLSPDPIMSLSVIFTTNCCHWGLRNIIYQTQAVPACAFISRLPFRPYWLPSLVDICLCVCVTSFNLFSIETLITIPFGQTRMWDTKLSAVPLSMGYIGFQY
jgi:hypothetical protein